MNLFEGDLDAAEGFFHRGIGLHRSVDDEGSALAASFMLAMTQAYAGRPREALQTCAGVVERASAAGELWNRAYAHWVAAICHLHLDDLPRARASIAETIRIEQDFRDGVCTALSIEVSSWIVAASGRTSDAAALSGIAGAVWHRIGTSLQAFGPHAASEGRQHASLIDERLGASCAAAVRAEYGQVGVPEAVRLGIEITDGAADGAAPRPEPGPHSPQTSASPTSAPRAAASPASSPLTGRERQIAQLIADGMSNRDIAAELTISVRTVDGHVERILRKLDFGSRTQVASWMAAAARVRS